MGPGDLETPRNSNAVLLAAAAGGLVLATGLAERRRSLAIISVLGGRRRQVRGLVLSEAAVVTVGEPTGGALVAWGLSVMLVKAGARTSTKPAVEELREL